MKESFKGVLYEDDLLQGINGMYSLSLLWKWRWAPCTFHRSKEHKLIVIKSFVFLLLMLLILPSLGLTRWVKLHHISSQCISTVPDNSQTQILMSYPLFPAQELWCSGWLIVTKDQRHDGSMSSFTFRCCYYFIPHYKEMGAITACSLFMHIASSNQFCCVCMLPLQFA